MEIVKVQEEAEGSRIQKHYLLKAECRGYGIAPWRKRELAEIRLPIILDFPITMTEETALLIALNRLSQRDFSENYRNDFCSYTERYVVAK